MNIVSVEGSVMTAVLWVVAAASSTLVSCTSIMLMRFMRLAPPTVAVGDTLYSPP